MNSKFGKHYPVLGKTNERERLLFVAAAGLAFSLLIILVAVFNFRSPAEAGQDVSMNQAIPAAIGTVTLLTPERYVRAGTKLTEVKLKEVYWPRAQLPEGAIREASEVMNMFAKVDLQAGVPLQKHHVTAEQRKISLPLTPGNRAVTIKVDAESSIENHATPGTRVDLVLTHYIDGQLTSKVIVQNARVLSLGGDVRTADQRAVDSRGSRRNQWSQTITLDVPPQSALQIQTAKKLGTLSLLMRSMDDTKPVEKQEFDQNEIDGGRGRADRNQRNVCKKGHLKIKGNEFVVNCDGTLSQVLDPYEP
ncbi:Flp pilus assembly protein CpaB [Oligoflexia bacterium]|nr:Flp pilus assembly protein CpaB [Oligoflexia bacterium]